MVETLPSNPGGVGSIPGQGAEISVCVHVCLPSGHRAWVCLDGDGPISGAPCMALLFSPFVPRSIAGEGSPLYFLH